MFFSGRKWTLRAALYGKLLPAGELVPGKMSTYFFAYVRKLSLYVIDIPCILTPCFRQAHIIVVVVQQI